MRCPCTSGAVALATRACSRPAPLTAPHALAAARPPKRTGHVFITSQGVRQNVTDLLGQTAANEVFAAHAATVQMVRSMLGLATTALLCCTASLPGARTNWCQVGLPCACRP